jgi:hypothetical protein
VHWNWRGDRRGIDRLGRFAGLTGRCHLARKGGASRYLCSFISFPPGVQPVTKIAFLLALIVAALASMPAHAQPARVFVSGLGLDTNPCTESQPCRTFQKAHDTAAANGEIQALDPAGYGALTITKGISIHGHGFGAITQVGSCPTCAAITIAVVTSDFTSNPVMLNGLLLDGGGTGLNGINITSSTSVQVLNSIIGNFSVGINNVASSNNTRLLVEDTIVSDNLSSGINVAPSGSNANATLSRTTASNNQTGVIVSGGTTMIANSVISNNRNGLSILGGVAILAKNVISTNNQGGIFVNGGTGNSYGDNYVFGNGRNIFGTLNSPNVATL